jgi:prevent-host-death family protein
MPRMNLRRDAQASVFDNGPSIVQILSMQSGKTHAIAVSDAKGQLTELVRRAEAGEEVVLTRHGTAVVRLVPIKAKPTAADRRALLEKVRTSGPKSAAPGGDAARSQDFLYDEDGLPR